MSNKIKTIKLYVKEKQIELKKKLKLEKQSLKNEDPKIILLVILLFNKSFSSIHKTRDGKLDIPEGLLTEEAKEALNFLYKNNLFDNAWFEELKGMVDEFDRTNTTYNVSYKDVEAHAILNNKVNTPIDNIANAPIGARCPINNTVSENIHQTRIDRTEREYIDQIRTEREYIDQIMNNCSCPELTDEWVSKRMTRSQPKIQEVSETITAPQPKIQEVAEIITTPIEIQEVAETIAAPLVKPAHLLRSSLNALKDSVGFLDLNSLKKAYSPVFSPNNFFAKYVPQLRFVETIELTTVENFVFSG